MAQLGIPWVKNRCETVTQAIHYRGKPTKKSFGSSNIEKPSFFVEVTYALLRNNKNDERESDTSVNV